MFRPDKKLKRKKQHKDWRKKANILSAWKRNHDQEKEKPPVKYPKSRKVTLKKDEQTKSKNEKRSVRGPVGPNND